MEDGTRPRISQRSLWQQPITRTKEGRKSGAENGRSIGYAARRNADPFFASDFLPVCPLRIDTQLVMLLRKKLWQKNGGQKNRRLYANISRPFFCHWILLPDLMLRYIGGQLRSSMKATPRWVAPPSRPFD
jgi:hypothetical protein